MVRTQFVVLAALICLGALIALACRRRVAGPVPVPRAVPGAPSMEQEEDAAVRAVNAISAQLAARHIDVQHNTWRARQAATRAAGALNTLVRDIVARHTADELRSRPFVNIARLATMTYVGRAVALGRGGKVRGALARFPGSGDTATFLADMKQFVANVRGDLALTASDTSTWNIG